MGELGTGAQLVFLHFSISFLLFLLYFVSHFVSLFNPFSISVSLFLFTFSFPFFSICLLSLFCSFFPCPSFFLQYIFPSFDPNYFLSNILFLSLKKIKPATSSPDSAQLLPTKVSVTAVFVQTSHLPTMHSTHLTSSVNPANKISTLIFRWHTGFPITWWFSGD